MQMAGPQSPAILFACGCLRGRDCFVAQRAPRNDNICRHCEPTGPAFGRPDDRLREAISIQDRFFRNSKCSGSSKARIVVVRTLPFELTLSTYLATASSSGASMIWTKSYGPNVM